MKLSKLYSNQNTIFEPIVFNNGFNVVYGDIRHPERYELDTHNLGKTTLAKLLDFMFLAKRHPKQFLFKHEERFAEFIFFLELELADGSYLTIRRSIKENTRIFFKKHNEKQQDFSSLTDNLWSHGDVAIDNAKVLLEGWLHFDILSQYPYRKIIGYLVRTQEDFRNVFKLNKEAGKDLYWKPYMADLLGFDGDLAKQHYEKLAEVNKLKDKISAISLSDMDNVTKELSKIDNKLLLRQKELTKLQEFIDNFNFDEIDQEKIEQLVNSIDNEIANLNMREYSIKNNIHRINESLNTVSIKFNTSEIENLFKEANILFPEEVSKDFNQLIDFNKAITKERKKFLKEELSELQSELVFIEDQLESLNLERANHLSFLSETKLVTKFRESNKEIARVQAEIAFLDKQKENIDEIQSLTKGKRALETELDSIQDDMQVNLTEVNEVTDSVFSNVRIYFNEIISKVFNKEGSITVYLNKNGNFEFDATYQDFQGNNTSEGDGNTYGKFLCIAFDLAVARAYLDKNYPKFLYIDGALEVLDDRKRKLLLEVLREYSSLGIQIIITTISSETSGFPQNPFNDKEIVLTFHDDGKNGRLFKMPAW
ncbi:DUF2326 domain-containing protein [Psychrobacter urativorans]|uniref:DUF2326 domain-containing protein n=1 Tax=Psychrobacter urativorans TaxID=45610 RepID=UPI00191AE448|nr:DUF2326 domain-containing protein [Psychrobacter urativorans]